MDKKYIVKMLLSGKVALLPTDTVYGLAASPNHPEAIDTVFKIKNRPKAMNLPIMLSSVEEILPLGFDVNDNAKKLLSSLYVPGALTVVLGFNDDIPRAEWLKGREEAAIRIPSDEWLLSILRETGPLLVTSANAHGSKANMGNVAEILKEVSHKPDVVIDKGILSNVASTIVNCRYSPPIIEREGQISNQEIQNQLDK